MATSVEAVDPAKNNSEIIGTTSDEATVSMDLQDAKCHWNDAEFSQGDQVNLDGKYYVCSFGRWVEVSD